MQEKFISKEKLSKKAQKELAKAKRGNWGLVKPITKIKPSAKEYNRKKFKEAARLDYGRMAS